MVLGLGALLALTACEAQTLRPAGASAGQARGQDSTAQANAEPGYTVEVELPPQMTRGQEAIARVRVQPKAPWHMNLEYPAKLRLEASDEVSLDQALLKKGDADRFDDQELVFSVVFTPEARGSQTIEAEVDFAVCGQAACGPVTEAVRLAFEVGCREEDSGLC